ncbi:FHA domain-containing protein [Cellulomonas sp. 179-A 4D5 NHS]|uniref:FHA domain-containing protein n=1 Tax=Cellulomonas sp. 179-A 4D5 NHS TaxID=3142378 RepID=UPI0039A1F374
MIVPEYTPGDWHAVVAGGVVALLAPTTPPSVVRAVWDAVPADGGLADQLEVLLTGGIARLQPFALVDLTGGRVHAALRGPVEVEVSGPDGSSVLAAGEVTTWSERVAEGADVVTVRVAGAGTWTAAEALPVVSGVVRASAVQVPLAVRDDAAGSGTTSASVPVEATVEPSEPEATPDHVVETAAAAEATAVLAGAPAPADAVPAGFVDLAKPVHAESVPAEPVDREPVDAETVDAEPVTAAASDEPAAGSRTEPATHSAELPLASGTAGSPAGATAAPSVPAASPVLPLHVAELPMPAFQAVDAPAPAREQLDADPARDPQADLARTWSTPTPVLPAAERPAEHAAVPALVPDDEDLDDDDDTYGADVVAAAEAVLQGEAAAQTDLDLDDDHDGLTILSSDLVAIRDQLPSWAADEVPGPFRVVAPEVDPTAKLVLSTGLVVALDRSVLLGRAPQVSRVTNRELPRLVTVPSPQQDISRTHAEVRAEGDDVLVTDLNSTNGILVSRPGERARRLHPGEATVVAAGEVVDLGDGVTFTVERGA